MQVVESGGRNIEVATMRQGEPLKIWSDEDVSAPWDFDIFCWRLGFRVQDSEGYTMWEGGGVVTSGLARRCGEGQRARARPKERKRKNERALPRPVGEVVRALPPRERMRGVVSLSRAPTWEARHFTTLVADHPHSVLRREFQPDSKQKTVGISVGTTLCPYGWPMVGF